MSGTVMPAAGRRPILMMPDEALTLQRAEGKTGVPVSRLRRWCKTYGISRQATRCAPLEISYPALVMVQHGDMEALELLRDYRRDHPRVRQYFDLIGLPAG